MAIRSMREGTLQTALFEIMEAFVVPVYGQLARESIAGSVASDADLRALHLHFSCDLRLAASR